MSNSWGIPLEIEKAVLERDKCCVYCGSEFGIERAKKKSWEHIINDIRITTLDNIALCCVGCNASKGNKDLITWFYSNNAKKRGITPETISDVIKTAINNLGSTIDEKNASQDLKLNNSDRDLIIDLLENPMKPNNQMKELMALNED